MAAGPVHDLSVEREGPLTCSRYSRERKASVAPPFCANRTSSTPEPPLASPIELLVVPKSIPIRKAGAGSGIPNSPGEPILCWAGYDVSLPIECVHFLERTDHRLLWSVMP